MDASVKKLTRAALMAALSVVLLWLGTVLPSGRLALTAISGVLTALTLIHCGAGYAWGVFAAAGILGLLLLPQKAPALLYLALLGYYPLLKSFLERLHRRWAEWTLKLLVCNAALFVVLLLARELLAPQIRDLPQILIHLGVSVVFVIYDRGLTGLLQYYIRQISGHIR